MPVLPDICAYLVALEDRILGRTLEQVSIRNPFFLRSIEPSLESVTGRKVTGFERLGKRIAIGLSDDNWLVIHLMIAGRLQWTELGAAARKSPRTTLAIFRFDSGALSVTETGTKKRASLHVVHGRNELQNHDPGGLDVLACDLDRFAASLRRENHTLKRALTDPRILSGIGNAYSDEILHAARLVPHWAHEQARRGVDAESFRGNAGNLAPLA